VDLIYEHISPGEFLEHRDGSTTLRVAAHADTAEVTRWLLLPEGSEYHKYRIIRYETEKPQKVEAVQVVNDYLADDFTILAYKLLSVKGGYTYELTWFYK